MKKSVMLLCVAVALLATSRTKWFLEGNEAVAAAKQVTRENYDEARLKMEFWRSITKALDLAIAASLLGAGWFAARSRVKKISPDSK